MYYNYHAKNIRRIRAGELIAVGKSTDENFAFILLFSTPPFTRPVRPHSAHKYEEFFLDAPFLAFFATK